MMSLRYVKDIQEEMSRSDEYGARTQRGVWTSLRSSPLKQRLTGNLKYDNTTNKWEKPQFKKRLLCVNTSTS